jgi:hypothetical protein
MDNQNLDVIGTFELGGTKMRVSDPCYDKDVWCAGILENCVPGFWSAYLVLSDEGAWGVRVKELRVSNLNESHVEPTELVDIDAGVDSGQCGFWDEMLYPEGEREYDDMNGFYRTVCNLTHDETDHSVRGGVVPFGAVSSSGYGDGGYSVYVGRNAAGQIVSAKIDYIPDNVEDEEDYND